MFRDLPRIGITGLALLLGSAASRGAAADGTLEIYWIDSEGGGSTLVVTPAGESVLIDSGNPGVRDPGRIHRVATETAGLKKIDHLIVTHFHIDHFGGAAELAALMPVANLWDNGLPEADPDGNRESNWPLTSKPYRQMTVGERHVVKPGTAIPLRPGPTALDLRCYIARQETWAPPGGGRVPPGEAGAVPAKPRDPSDNANSSAWILSFGPFRFYDGGDLTWNSEATLVWPKILVPEVDVCQVTHHGLDASNHPGLFRALNPTVSVMNNGPTKGTMAEVMQTLRSLPLLKAQYQMHRNLREDGKTNNCPEEFIANLTRDCAGAFIHCTVAADGGNYSISIPGRTQVTSYKTRATGVSVN